MRKRISDIQHWWSHIINIENSRVKFIFKTINNFNLLLFWVVIFFSLVFGYIINLNIEFPEFHIFQILFTVIFVISFFSIRFFEKQMEECHRLMAGDNNLQPINDKVYRLRRSALNLIVPPAAGAIFGLLAISLVNINLKSLTAIYLIFTYILCVLISFLGYLQYIYLALYIWKLGHNKKKIIKYNSDYPCNTNWIIVLTRLYCSYRNIFFLLGAAYVFGVIYFVLCGSFRVVEKIIMNSLYNIPLFLFWTGVLIAIVIFFPLVSIIEFKNIKYIIGNLKEQSVVTLNTNGMYDADIKIQKSHLIIAILNTPDYPIKDILGIAFSGAVTSINLLASIVAIIQFPIS